VQLGPQMPSSSTESTESVDSTLSEPSTERVVDTGDTTAGTAVDTTAGTTGDTAGIAVESQEGGTGGESFFETWAKGQEMPLGPSLLFMAGVLLALIVVMRSLMKSSAKRKLQTHTMGNPTERIEKMHNRAKGSMDPARQAMVDAEDLTRRMGAVLDNKATKIEILLEEANQRIEQLERANREVRRTVESEQAGHAHADHAERSGGMPEALDRARLDQDRAERTWVEPEKPTKPAESESNESIFRIDRGMGAKAREESPHRLTFPEQVDELATQGLNALEIANKLNRLVGEVELVLNLRRNSG